MPKLPVVTGEKAARALERAGFVFDRQSGGHKIMKHYERGLTVSVPVHGSKTVRPGTLRAIIRDAGLTVPEFQRLLK